uniref:Uncharacterized protein n=1 Tax=Anguilla anguilla TaxID=7936 RepID=A0A0E9T8X1_ANGAN
MKSASAFAP